MSAPGMKFVSSFGHESESDSDESMSFLNNIQPVKVTPSVPAVSQDSNSHHPAHFETATATRRHEQIAASAAAAEVEASRQAAAASASVAKSTSSSKQAEEEEPWRVRLSCSIVSDKTVGGIVDTVTIPGANETEEAGDDSSDSPEQVTEWTEGNVSQSSAQSGSDRSSMQLNASAGSSPRKVGGSTVSSSSLSNDNTREKHRQQHQHGPGAEAADHPQQGQASSRTAPPAPASRQQQQQQQQQHHQSSPVTATTTRPISASQRQHEASSTPPNVRSVPLIAAEKTRSPPTRPSGAALTPQTSVRTPRQVADASARLSRPTASSSEKTRIPAQQQQQHQQHQHHQASPPWGSSSASQPRPTISPAVRPSASSKEGGGLLMLREEIRRLKVEARHREDAVAAAEQRGEDLKRKLEAALSGENRQKSEIRHLLSERVALEAQVDMLMKKTSAMATVKANNKHLQEEQKFLRTSIERYEAAVIALRDVISLTLNGGEGGEGAQVKLMGVLMDLHKIKTSRPAAPASKLRSETPDGPADSADDELKRVSEASHLYESRMADMEITIREQKSQIAALQGMLAAADRRGGGGAAERLIKELEEKRVALEERTEVCEALERKLSILGRSRESEIRRVKREAANALSAARGASHPPVSPRKSPSTVVSLSPNSRLGPASTSLRGWG